jgi:hypothetical protein
VEKAARVGGDGFQITALRLGIESAEGDRRLAGAGHAGEHDKSVPRDIDVDVPEVVLAGTADADLVRRSGVFRVAKAVGGVEAGDIHA